MIGLRRGVVVGLTGACALVVAAAPGSAAPGGGAVVVPSTCTVTVPGFPDATGEARVTLLPNGRQHVNCNAQLPAGAPTPPRNTKFDLGACTVTISKSGAVTSHCHQ